MTGFVQRRVYDLNKTFKVQVDTSSAFSEEDPRIMGFQGSNLKDEAYATCADVFMEIIREYLLKSSQQGLTSTEIINLDNKLVFAFQKLSASAKFGSKRVVLFFCKIDFDSKYDQSSKSIDLFAKYTVMFKENNLEDLGAAKELVTVKHFHRIQTVGTEHAIDKFSSDPGDFNMDSLPSSTNTFELSRDQTGTFPDFSVRSSASDGNSMLSVMGSMQTA